jgi:hypothetical protein
MLQLMYVHDPSVGGATEAVDVAYRQRLDETVVITGSGMVRNATCFVAAGAMHPKLSLAWTVSVTGPLPFAVNVTLVPSA